MHKQLLNKEKSISVTGLGYVGLPVALEFSKKFKVIAFDLDPLKIKQLKMGIDPSRELASADFEGAEISFTSDFEELSRAQFHIIAVPTPVDESKNPDLTALKSASKQIAKILKAGDYVVYESTVFPGCTEEVCLPILEEISGLEVNTDFHLGYSPERINPGDKKHTLTKIVKVVSGSSKEATLEISKIYGAIISAGIHEASSIKVAEAAKVIENTQRDLNIALINELSIIFDRLEIDTLEVLEAAGTKWNFLKFYPGLVGGHCIGIDPYYLTYKAKSLGYNPQIILSGRDVNDKMPEYIAEKIAIKLSDSGKEVGTCRVLQLGLAFKENINDLRNSKAVELAQKLNERGFCVHLWDPLIEPHQLTLDNGVIFKKPEGEKFDVIIIAVAHQQFLNYSDDIWENHLLEDGWLFDIKGILSDMILPNTNYWRL